jgi:hypothetical protein
MISKTFRRSLAGCVATAAALLALGPPAGLPLLPDATLATAHAATYTQHTCRLPSGDPASTDGWSSGSSSGGFLVENSCATGGFLGLAMQAGWSYAEGAGRGWSWSPPPGVSLQGVRLRRAFTLAAQSGDVAPMENIYSGPRDIEKSSDFLNGVTHQGAMSTWNGAGNDLTELAPNTGLALLLACNGNSLLTCTPTTQSELRLFQAALTLYDGSDPTVSSVSGTLTDAEPKRGTESLVVTASDSGSGLYQALVEVDGGPARRVALDGNGGRCVDADPASPDPYEFEHGQPCKLAISSGQVDVDVSNLSEGEHALRVRVVDASGNSAHAYGPGAIIVDNVPLPVASEAPWISGDAQEERRLEVQQGTWTNLASRAYQWKRCEADGSGCIPIPGATAQLYTLTAADVNRRVLVEVTALNSAGEATIVQTPASQQVRARPSSGGDVTIGPLPARAARGAREPPPRWAQELRTGPAPPRARSWSAWCPIGAARSGPCTGGACASPGACSTSTDAPSAARSCPSRRRRTSRAPAPSPRAL